MGSFEVKFKAMKSFSLIIAIAGFSLASCGQDIPDSKVPSVVLNAVKAKYPGAADIDWEKKKNIYEAEFDTDSIEHVIQVDAAGRILQLKREITLGELPATVQENLKSGYAGFTPDDVAVIEKEGQLYYEVELEAKGKKDKKVIYSAEGKSISKL
jgi:uncharacterized membrane protein YkoI